MKLIYFSFKKINKMDSESWEVIEDNENIKKEFLDYFYGLVSK